MHIRSSFNAGGTESLIRNIYNTRNKYFKIKLALLKGGELISDLSNPENSYEIFERKGKIDFKVLKNLSALIKKDKIEIVHTHQTMELFYALLLKIKDPGIKLVHHVHSFNDKRDWTFYLERLICRFFVSKVISVSKSLNEFLISSGFPAKKTVVLENAIEMPGQSNEGLRKEFNKAIKYKEGDRIIGMIGNFVKEKDQLTLIKSFMLVKKEFPELKLVLIGKEDAEGEIRNSIPGEILNSEIFLFGQVNHASRYIPFWNIFIFSTLKETFGIVVLEAMMNEVSVIASDVPAMKDLSENGFYFNLFEVKSENDLVKKIRNKLKNPDSKEKLKAAATYVKMKYGIEDYMKKLKSIYEAA